MNLKEKEIFEKILLLEKELDIRENPENNLLKQFVLPGTSLIEAIFRILVLNKNQPMTITEMETNLREAWASVIYLKSYSHDTIARMLNATNEYFIKKNEDYILYFLFFFVCGYDHLKKRTVNVVRKIKFPGIHIIRPPNC